MTSDRTGTKTRKVPSAKSLANLEPTKWKPGQSGNPGGRPKKGLLTDEIEAMANELVPDEVEKMASKLIPGGKKNRTWKRFHAERLFMSAGQGKVQAAAEIMDRVEGKAIQRVDMALSLPDDDPKDKLRAFISKIRTRKSKAI